MKRGRVLTLEQVSDDVTDRRGHRRPVRISAQLLRGDVLVAAVRLRNLSRYGFMAEGSGAIEIGETLALDGAWPAAGVYIAWALAGRIGGEFLSPLDLPVLERMIAQDQSRG